MIHTIDKMESIVPLNTTLFNPCFLMCWMELGLLVRCRCNYHHHHLVLSSRPGTYCEMLGHWLMCFQNIVSRSCPSLMVHTTLQVMVWIRSRLSQFARHGGHFPRGKEARAWSWPHTPSSTEIKNAWSYTSGPSTSSWARCSILGKDNFTVTFLKYTSYGRSAHVTTRLTCS